MNDSTMNVIEMREPGPPEVLQQARRDRPRPGPGELLIEVVAAGVNGPDLVQRRGHYPPPKGASDLLGLEVAGTVAALGEGVSDWRVGQPVCALTNGGGYAEFTAVDAGHCLAWPTGLDAVAAASLPETFFTVWSNVFLPGRLAAGGVFLVHGGAGGIGSTAIQLGAARGARVFTTVADAAQAEFCRALGAERCIDYTQEDFVEVVRAEAGGADCVLDIIAGDYFERNIKACSPDASIVQLAFNGGAKVTANLMPIMLKRLTYTGSTLRSRPEAFKTRVASELREQVWPLFAAGKLRAVVNATLPLAEAAEAHRRMEAATHLGKLVLLTGA